MTAHTNTFSIQRPSFLGGGNWTLSKLTDITVLFGKNGVGKSWLLRNLRDQNRDAYHYASPERAGEIQFNANYMQEELSGITRANKRNRNLSPTYREEVIARIQAYLAKRGNSRSKIIPEAPNEIEDMLNLLMPDFAFALKDGNPPFQLMRLIPQQQVTSVNELSSGEAEMITLALDLLLICAMWKLEGINNGLLLIDEPDTHLHPDLQQQLAKFLVAIGEKYGVQMLITTHSTTLLSALGYHGQARTSVVYLNNAADAQEARVFDLNLQELATCLGGHALMGPLFGSPLFLVEGDDDYQIWSQVPRHGIIKLAVIPCHGAAQIDNYRRRLEEIFQSLLPTNARPTAYQLKDGDKPVNNNGFTHVICLNLACHESENLFITDEVLTLLGTTWEAAKVRIKQESHKYGNKKEILNTVDEWDRKHKDIKIVINELSSILDEKHVHWTIRVGKCIGKQKPVGQLAEFLGDALVNVLWGEISSNDVTLVSTSV